MARYGPVARANATRELRVEFGTKDMQPSVGLADVQAMSQPAGCVPADTPYSPLSMCLLLQSPGGGVFALTQTRTMLRREWRTIDESTNSLP
jgi:hypothetical protein